MWPRRPAPAGGSGRVLPFGGWTNAWRGQKAPPPPVLRFSGSLTSPPPQPRHLARSPSVRPPPPPPGAMGTILSPPGWAPGRDGLRLGLRFPRWELTSESGHRRFQVSRRRGRPRRGGGGRGRWGRPEGPAGGGPRRPAGRAAGGVGEGSENEAAPGERFVGAADGSDRSDRAGSGFRFHQVLQVVFAFLRLFNPRKPVLSSGLWGPTALRCLPSLAPFSV